ADAQRCVPSFRQAVYNIGFVEDARLLRHRRTPVKVRGEEARMWTRRRGRRQESREERVMSSISKTCRRVTLFPTTRRQDRREVRRAAVQKRRLRDVVTQRVERDKQNVGVAD